MDKRINNTRIEEEKAVVSVMMTYEPADAFNLLIGKTAESR